MIGICFRIFTGGCKQFCTGELVFRYLEFVFHGNLFSLVLHSNVAFAVWLVFERICTTYDAVGDVMVWMAIR